MESGGEIVKFPSFFDGKRVLLLTKMSCTAVHLTTYTNNKHITILLNNNKSVTLGSDLNKVSLIHKAPSNVGVCGGSVIREASSLTHHAFAHDKAINNSGQAASTCKLERCKYVI